MEKKCSKCGEIKDISGFYRHNKEKNNGYNYQCKECVKKYQHDNRFRISLRQGRKRAERKGYEPCNATLEEIEKAFTGSCAICSVLESEYNQKLHMDHDHTTGNFRGWICWNCNNLLGRARDNPEILRLGALYLERNI